MKGLYITIVLVLVGYSQCDSISSYIVDITCGKCSSTTLNNCMTMVGGEFNSSTNIGLQSCSSLANSLKIGFPLRVIFSCNTVCSGSCGINFGSSNSISPPLCQGSDNGNFFSAGVQIMNDIYAFSKNDPGATYDWCGYAGCGSESIGKIIGIVIAAVVGSALLIAIISGTVRYCRKRKEGAYDRNKDDKAVEMIE